MTDLTLNEYRNVSGGELRPILKEEAWKIYGRDSIKKDEGKIPSSEKIMIFFQFSWFYFLLLFKKLLSPLDIKSFLIKLGVNRY